MNILLVDETDHLSSGIYHRALSNGNTVHVLNREGRKTVPDDTARVIQADLQTEREQEIRKKLSGICYDAIVDFTVSDSRELKKHLDSFRGCCRRPYPRWIRELACQISWIRCFGIHWYCLRGIHFIQWGKKNSPIR